MNCTFVNTAVFVDLQLDKQWVNGIKGDGTKLSLLLAGASPTLKDSIADGRLGAWLDTLNRITVPVRIGALVSFVEELRADNVGTYNSSFDCTGIAAEGDGTTIAQFEVGDSDISCTFVNAAATRQITLVKEWVNGQAGDEADLTIESRGCRGDRHVNIQRRPRFVDR